MKKPHLTPSHLFSNNQFPGEWNRVKTAYICFTPFPQGFAPYVKEIRKQRFFLHSPPSEVRFCQYGENSFVVISEVYGFAVGTTTVEELIHYGVETIIGVGYVGAFNGAPTAQKFLTASARSDLSVGLHYGYAPMKPAFPSKKLNNFLKGKITKFSKSCPEYHVWNSNSLYREYEEVLEKMKSEGCQVVNMDSLSVFAAAELCARESEKRVEYAYLGTVTDSSGGEEGWDTDLMETIGGDKSQSHDELIQILVEELIPSWLDDNG